MLSPMNIMSDDELIEFQKALENDEAFSSLMKRDVEYAKKLKNIMDSKIHNAVKEFCNKTSLIPTINISFNTFHVADQKEPLGSIIEVTSTIHLTND